MKLSEKACNFAWRYHRGQCRPNLIKEPKTVHLREVAELVEKSGGTDEEIAIAWLHDILEDTKVTKNFLAGFFDKEIVQEVEALTDPEDIRSYSTIQAKALQANKLANKSKSAKRVKLADQISNLCSVLNDPPVNWNDEDCMDYIEGCMIVANVCVGVSKFLDREFNKVLAKCLRRYSPNH